MAACLLVMSSEGSSHVSTNSQSQQPGWGSSRTPLPPHRLAKLANALGVAAPLPAIASNGTFLSPSAVPSGHSPPLLDIPWRAPTPSVASSSQSKYLLHVIPPTYPPHDDVADSSELIPPPPGASGYHPQFRRGILVTLQSTLQAQLVVIAKEYALPSTFGMVLYLVRSSPQDNTSSSRDRDAMEPGPRLSEDMWKHIWTRVLRAERDDASSSCPSPSPNGLGLNLESNGQTHALRPLVTPTRTESPLSLSLANPVTPSPTFASSVPDFRSQTKADPSSALHSDPYTPDISPSDQELPGIELPGLKSPSIVPILAKVEFDIDRRRAGWYEPWLRSRRITHSRRTESRSSNRTGSQSRAGDETSPSDDRRGLFDLKLVGRMQKPGFLRSMEECHQEHPPDDEYNPLDSPDAIDDEAFAGATSRITSDKDKDPLTDIFGTDAETWANMHSNSQGLGKNVDPNVVQLALDAPSLAPLSSHDEVDEQGNGINDVEEVHAIMQRMSGPPLTSPTISGGHKRPIPPPLVLAPKSPNDVIQGGAGSLPPSRRTSTNLPYVSGSDAVSDIEFRDKEGLSLELEQEYLRSRTPSEDKRVGALFEDLDLGLDFDDDEEV